MCRTNLARERFALALTLMLGCGGRAPAPAPAQRIEPGRDAGGPPIARDGLASLDEIAARGAFEAPQMREIARWSDAATAPALRAEQDLCVRVAFAAPASVRAWLEDAAGARRGDVSAGAGGMIPPGGPACARRGETLRVVVDGAAAGASVRAVVFGAP